MITKTSLQIIKALLVLAELPEGKAQGVVRIANSIHVPQNYLGKVLQRLVHEGIVFSQKGLNGGFRLAKPASSIKLYDVVSCIEDLRRLEGCFMGNATCSNNTPCLAHHRWTLVRSTYIDFLNNTTIDNLKLNKGAVL